MSTIRSDEGWAIVHMEGRPWPFVMGMTFRRTRGEAIASFGEVWAREGETSAQGWKRARKAGARAVRARCEVIGAKP